MGSCCLFSAVVYFHLLFIFTCCLFSVVVYFQLLFIFSCCFFSVVFFIFVPFFKGFFELILRISEILRIYKIPACSRCLKLLLKGGGEGGVLRTLEYIFFIGN